MRSTTAWIGLLVLAGGGIFWMQRTEIVRLRTQVGEQGSALANNQRRLEDLSLAFAGPGAPAPLTAQAAVYRRSDDGVAALRADERRLILDQYRDVLAGMNLPAETASRLQDLLADRIETVLDAEDAAMRVGFAAGSAATARAVAMAVQGVDSQIVGLIGAERTRFVDEVPAAEEPPPAIAPAPAAPSIVTVVVQAPPAAPAEAYGDAAASSDIAPALPYVPYYYYAPAVYGPGVLVGPAFGRRGPERSHPLSMRPAEAVGRRSLGARFAVRASARSRS